MTEEIKSTTAEVNQADNTIGANATNLLNPANPLNNSN